MQNPVLVTESDTLEQVIHERLDRGRVESTPIAASVHVLLQILVHVFEDQHELVLGVNDVVQQDDVLVFQFLHKGYLTDSRRGGAFLRIEVDLFKRDKLAGLAVTSFEDLRTVRSVLLHVKIEPYRRICALAQLLELLEGAGVSAVVHGGWEGRCVAAAEVAYADGRVGAVCDREGARVGRTELARRWTVCVLRIPEDGAR